MGRILLPRDELDALFVKSLTPLTSAINDLMVAIFKKNKPDVTAKQRKLGDVLAGGQGLADMMGRRRLLLEMDAFKSRDPKVRKFSLQGWYASPRGASPLVPKVPFSQAIQDMIERTPRLAQSAEEVSDVYSSEHGFALAKSASIQITEKVQDIVQKAIDDGTPVKDAADLIAKAGNFSRGYAETVYRTNLNTAYSAGRFQIAQDPDIQAIAPAFEYMILNDSDVRRGRKEDSGENHKALDGLIAGVNDKIWQTYAPPNGYNCRCTLRLVSIFELEAKGLIKNGIVRLATVPSNAVIHPNFSGGRPDFKLYSGAA